MVGPHRGAVPALLAALLVLLTACGGDDDEGGTVAAPDEPVTELTIRSSGLSFDIESFQVPAGEEVTLTYENAHRGVSHNIHIDTGDDGPATEVARGPDTKELTFTLDEPGELPYICDVHPIQMKGTVTVV